jgi:hypothetical protein
VRAVASAAPEARPFPEQAIRELNPRGKTIMPELLEWLKETYHFDKAPSSITDLDEKTRALAFERGQFQAKEEIFVDISLKIFNDGIVAETQSSTHDSEAFLEDTLSSATKDFSLAYKPKMIRSKIYFSELYVESVKTLSGMNPRVSEFAAQIASLVPNNAGTGIEFASLGFWPIHPQSHAVIGPFRFERKLHTLPGENKYYATAPLHTDDHLKMLDEFESIFMS